MKPGKISQGTEICHIGEEKVLARIVEWDQNYQPQDYLTTRPLNQFSDPVKVVSSILVTCFNLKTLVAYFGHVWISGIAFSEMNTKLPVNSEQRSSFENPTSCQKLEQTQKLFQIHQHIGLAQQTAKQQLSQFPPLWFPCFDLTAPQLITILQIITSPHEISGSHIVIKETALKELINGLFR